LDKRAHPEFFLGFASGAGGYFLVTTEHYSITNDLAVNSLCNEYASTADAAPNIAGQNDVIGKSDVLLKD
jgi:hypothetical protein